jgi:hypothetical protein
MRPRFLAEPRGPRSLAPPVFHWASSSRPPIGSVWNRPMMLTSWPLPKYWPQISAIRSQHNMACNGAETSLGWAMVRADRTVVGKRQPPG